MRRHIKQIISIITAVIAIWLSACDADSDVGSVPMTDTREPVSTNTCNANVVIHIKNISLDSIKAIEYEWGIGTYESVNETPFRQKQQIKSNSDGISKMISSDTNGIFTFDIELSYEENKPIYCNIRLLDNNKICIGNLVNIYQSEPITSANNSIQIDVSSDGVYGDHFICVVCGRIC